MTELRITSLGQRGEGLAEHQGRRVFVPFTLPGERVEAGIDGERGTLLSVLEPSPDRVAPFCPYFGTCGGCALQHAGPSSYAGFKQGLVRTALDFAGLATPVAPLLDARGSGRRRATLHADGRAAGYMRARSHDILDIERCPILVPALQQRGPRIAREIGAAIGPADIGLTATATGIDVAVKARKPPRPHLLVPLAQRLQLARLTVNGEPVLQVQPPAIRMGPATVELPPGSFLQATEAAETILAELVTAAVGKAKSVADLFCGAGPFTLRLARTARVFAADSDRPAIAALQQASNHTSGLKPVTAQVRDLFRDPLAPVELRHYDAVVIDPPRAGAEAQMRELSRSQVPLVVSVSCEPKSFARDAALLAAAGYRLENVVPVDQFAWSPHVELVGLFRK